MVWFFFFFVISIFPKRSKNFIIRKNKLLYVHTEFLLCLDCKQYLSLLFCETWAAPCPALPLSPFLPLTLSGLVILEVCPVIIVFYALFVDWFSKLKQCECYDSVNVVHCRAESFLRFRFLFGIASDFSWRF